MDLKQFFCGIALDFIFITNFFEFWEEFSKEKVYL